MSDRDIDLGDVETVAFIVEEGRIVIEGHGPDGRYVWALADKAWIEGSRLSWHLGSAVTSERVGELEVIVRDLAAGDEPISNAGEPTHGGWCVHCDEPEGLAHTEACPWRRAREWTQTHEQ